jgi:hypothetical protein
MDALAALTGLRDLLEYEASFTGQVSALDRMAECCAWPRSASQLWARAGAQLVELTH